MKNSFLILISIYLFISCSNDSALDLQKGEKIIEVSIRDQGVMCAEGVTDMAWFQSDTKAPFFEGLDALNYPITTSSKEAQRYFNQGLLLSYGFNHAEAARSFRQASRIDPDCAMCYWGFAYVLGPNYNAGMEPDNYKRAYDAIQTGDVCIIRIFFSQF